MKEVMMMTMNKKKVLAISLGALMSLSATAGFAGQNPGGWGSRGQGMMKGCPGMGQAPMARRQAQAPVTRDAYEEMLNKFLAEKKIDEAGKAALMRRYDAAQEFFAAREAAQGAQEKIRGGFQCPTGQPLMNGGHHCRGQGRHGMRDGRQGVAAGLSMNAAANPQAQAFCLRNQDGTVMDREAYGAKLDSLVEAKTLSVQGKEILMKRFDAVKAYVEGAGAAGLPMGRGQFCR